MKFIVVDALSMPVAGLHRAVIAAVELCTSLKNDYKTPQLKVIFESVDPLEKFRISKWYNLLGYKHDADGQVTLDSKTKRPIKDDKNTQACFNILGVDAGRLGLPADKEVSEQDLIGLSGGILVEPKASDPTKVEITQVMSTARLEQLA